MEIIIILKTTSYFLFSYVFTLYSEFFFLYLFSLYSLVSCTFFLIVLIVIFCVVQQQLYLDKHVLQTGKPNDVSRRGKSFDNFGSVYQYLKTDYRRSKRMRSPPNATGMKAVSANAVEGIQARA